MTSSVPDSDPTADPGPIPIDTLSASAYSTGRDPIDWAVFLAKTAIEVRDRVATYPHRGTGTLAGWADVSDDALARKIVGSLLEAGWSPPSPEAVEAASAETHRYHQAFDAWKATLSEADWNRCMDHYNQTGEFPPDLQPPAATPKG